MKAVLLMVIAAYAIAAEGPALSPAEILAAVAPVVRSDATVDIVQLDAALRAINDRVTASNILPTPADGDLSSEQPLATRGEWRLWVFWGMDTAESAGLASELVRVRASGVARLRPVHLASYRQWEAFLFRMNEYREALLVASRGRDKARVDGVWAMWYRELQELREMTEALYGGPMPLVSVTDQAELLQVTQIPSFRLISPGGVVHSLDGFTPGNDLVAWIGRCQEWDAAAERGGRR